MNVLSAIACSLWMLVVPASGWAILLNEAELQPIANQDPEVAKEVQVELEKLSFANGVIHVSGLQPARWLRFNSPGQGLNALLQLLQKLGFEVTLAFSAEDNPRDGIGIAQSEDGSKKLGVTIYTKFHGFDVTKLRVVMKGAK